MKKIIVSLPVILFLALVVITRIPYEFSIMSEPYHPWYTPYTSIVFILVSFFFFPVTGIFKIIGIGIGTNVLGLGYMITSFFYAIGISYMMNKICRCKSRNEINKA